jgi:hypothetical protein
MGWFGSRVSGAVAVVCLAGTLLTTACDRREDVPIEPSAVSTPAAALPPPPPASTAFVADGVVTDSDDRPLQGVVVTHPLSDANVITPGLSGPNGEFAVAFMVPATVAAQGVAFSLVAQSSNYEGPRVSARVQNFTLINTPLRLRLQPLFDLAVGASLSGVLQPNHPDWGLRRSTMCPCLRFHIPPAAAREVRIRVISPSATPLRVVVSAQNMPNADPYEDASAFFDGTSSLTLNGDQAISEIVVPVGFIYNPFAFIGRDGPSGVTAPVPFQIAVE